MEVMSMPSRHIVVVGRDYMSQLGIVLHGMPTGSESVHTAVTDMVVDVNDVLVAQDYSAEEDCSKDTSHRVHAAKSGSTVYLHVHRLYAVVCLEQLMGQFRYAKGMVCPGLDCVNVSVDDVSRIPPRLGTVSAPWNKVVMCVPRGKFFWNIFWLQSGCIHIDLVEFVLYENSAALNNRMLSVMTTLHVLGGLKPVSVASDTSEVMNGAVFYWTHHQTDKSSRTTGLLAVSICYYSATRWELLGGVYGFEELNLLCLGHSNVLLDGLLVMVTHPGIGTLFPELLKWILFTSLWEGSIVSLDTNNNFVNAEWLESWTKEKLQKAKVVAVACIPVVEAMCDYDQKYFNSVFLSAIVAWPNVTVIVFDEFHEEKGIVRRYHQWDHYSARHVLYFIDERHTWCGLYKSFEKHGKCFDGFEKKDSGVEAYQMDTGNWYLLLLVRHVVFGFLVVVSHVYGCLEFS
jgi:hypothetical protein